MPLHQETIEKPANKRRLYAVIFAAAGLGALAYSASISRQTYLQQHPPALPNVVAPIPENLLGPLHVGLKFVEKTVLFTTPEQEKQIDDLWKVPPRSLTEAIDIQKKMDQILTPEQREKYKPLRQGFRNKVIDQMLEPASHRLPPDDFEKLKGEIKRRVAAREESP